jgi:hypothetical protein
VGSGAGKGFPALSAFCVDDGLSTRSNGPFDMEIRIIRVTLETPEKVVRGMS